MQGDTALRNGFIVKGIQNIETNRAFTLEELEQFMNDQYSRKGQFWHENRGIPRMESRLGSSLRADRFSSTRYPRSRTQATRRRSLILAFPV